MAYGVDRGHRFRHAGGMKIRAACLFLIAFVPFTLTAMADLAPPPQAPPTEAAEKLPGVALAEAVSQITGVAVSPLLGVCGVGLWEYYKATPEARAALPWFCSPWFWGGGFVLLGLLFAKDLFGAAVPMMLKKPFDMLELFEDKASAIVASAALLPLLNNEIAEVFGGSVRVAATIPGSAAATPVLASVILVPLALVAFFAVWLCNHAVNVLLLLSPFKLADLLLKLMRGAFLILLSVLAAIAPVFAAILCGLLILVALRFAPRAFRISFFGTVMSFDFLRSLVWRSYEPRAIRAFLARRAGTAFPALTFGRLERDGAGLLFVSRHLIVGPRKTISLPGAPGSELERGFLYPTLRVPDAAAESGRRQFHLLPRHRQETERVAAALGVDAVVDPAVVRGVKAAFRKVADAFTPGQPQLTSTSP